jgi:hypothetical protein
MSATVSFVVSTLEKSAAYVVSKHHTNVITLGSLFVVCRFATTAKATQTQASLLVYGDS